MDASTQTVRAALGIELEDGNCGCATHASNKLVETGLAARNMARTNLEILTSCSIYYSNLRAAGAEAGGAKDTGKGERCFGEEVQRRQNLPRS